MNRHSIRFRLTIWYGAAVTAALALFSSLVWFSLRESMASEFERQLQGQTTRFEQYFRAESVETQGNHLRAELTEFSQALPPASYVSLHADNGFFFENREKHPNEDLRILRRTLTVDGTTYQLESALPAGDAAHTLSLLGWLLASLIPVMIAIACVGGAWLSRRALKPVDELSAATLAISIENLSERLPVPDTGDELAKLTQVLNSMLARLEAAVGTLSQFVADASHELRTPLAVIRTTAELALRRDRPAQNYRESLREVAAETVRMTQLVENLLLLARRDTGAAEMPLERIELCEVLRDVTAEMRGLAEVRRVQIKTSLGEEPALISGNRPALHRLFVVLIDNALKYSREDADVIVGLERSGGHLAVSIEDFGVGISAADLPHIFKRFYRGDRARSGGGHGLGLSLAESISRVHGATIEVDSREGEWTRFRVVFPAGRLSSNLQVETIAWKAR
jgi:heavy metal sensor kinase